MAELRSEQLVPPYDKHLLQRAQTQWQFGDWNSLAMLDCAMLQDHPDRAALAVFAAAGRLQSGLSDDARHYIRLALDWGTSRALVSKILISAIHNTLGRIAVAERQSSRAQFHFENSISTGASECDTRLIIQARTDAQTRQIELRRSRLEAERLQEGDAIAIPEASKTATAVKPNPAPTGKPFDVKGANNLISGITLTEQSRKRWPYFLKIEELQIALFLQLIAYAKPVRFFDIGANVGFYTLVAQKYFSRLRCVAFEPTPDTFTNLVENLNANEREGGAEASCVALSSKSGTAEFGDFGDCSGKNSIVSTSIHEQDTVKHRIRVPMETLDHRYAERLGRVIVKIDAEGHETEIIKGGASFFRKNEIVLQVETGHKENSHELDQLIRNQGLDPIFKLGPDSYYSNVPDLVEKSRTAELLENASRFLIAHRWDVQQRFE
ncbi:FkbM family methyltransferase [Paraburkholderia sp. UCT2]|uniref:FkbM family methyltransferase n=1 Tax=Paraburkholderia sp. UCT2 TaxID=2615208 RepID=UPI0016568159|nr:FkbM family methyltransferase [Paraburkholderia sp. UCT2]MBC8729037.1 FkbM family methyltransferase [Paraburkholderia sp. UCT2]